MQSFRLVSYKRLRISVRFNRQDREYVCVCTIVAIPVQHLIDVLPILCVIILRNPMFLRAKLLIQSRNHLSSVRFA